MNQPQGPGTGGDHSAPAHPHLPPIAVDVAVIEQREPVGIIGLEECDAAYRAAGNAAHVTCELKTDGYVWTREGGWLLRLDDDGHRAFGPHIATWPWIVRRLGRTRNGHHYFIMGDGEKA